MQRLVLNLNTCQTVDEIAWLLAHEKKLQTFDT